MSDSHFQRAEEAHMNLIYGACALCYTLRKVKLPNKHSGFDVKCI